MDSDRKRSVTIHGGDGNDTIEFNGAVISYLYGDAGDDAIFAVGTGGTPDSIPATVVGGAGHDRWDYREVHFPQAINLVMDSTLEDVFFVTEAARILISLATPSRMKSSWRMKWATSR